MILYRYQVKWVTRSSSVGVVETDILLFNSSESGDFDMPDSQKLDTSLDNCQPTTFSLVKCKHWTSTSATVMDNERPKDDEDFKASFFIPRSAG